MTTTTESRMAWGIAQAGGHRFRVGETVRLSDLGLERNLRRPSKRKNVGTVVKVDEFNSPTVLWEDRRTADGFAPSFIKPCRKPKRLRKDSRP